MPLNAGPHATTTRTPLQPAFAPGGGHAVAALTGRRPARGNSFNVNGLPAHAEQLHFWIGVDNNSRYGTSSQGFHQPGDAGLARRGWPSSRVQTNNYSAEYGPCGRHLIDQLHALRGGTNRIHEVESTVSQHFEASTPPAAGNRRALSGRSESVRARGRWPGALTSCSSSSITRGIAASVLQFAFIPTVAQREAISAFRVMDPVTR